jgi:hypothetical protein
MKRYLAFRDLDVGILVVGEDFIIREGKGGKKDYFCLGVGRDFWLMTDSELTHF